jgi:hypothetical protein
MITFQEFLNEAFDNAYEYDVIDIGTNGRTVEYQFEFKSDNDTNYYASVTYTKSSKVLQLDFKDDDRATTKATGTQGPSSIKVFSTLYAILMEARRNHRNSNIRFIALKNSDSRVKLYRALANRLATHLGMKVRETDMSNKVVFNLS